eukprot:TRINITY_DN3898_c0_g1_i2.p1 TRINITY_DN3898_c0_g1~~TRINITY_DN3898_c0_g1_i2.p1  ORF type:complete len:373 (+),score=49.60 TRINITY_DN3898_c0_g1_i2:37-1119(+)
MSALRGLAGRMPTVISRISTRTTTTLVPVLPGQFMTKGAGGVSVPRGMSFFHLAADGTDGHGGSMYGRSGSRSGHDRKLPERVPPGHIGIVFAPQQEAWVVERLGKFHKVLEPGINILIPVVDRIAYCHSLKETSIEIQKQSAITLDNVTLRLDGVLYWKVVDPFKASYGIDQCTNAIFQLAQTTMRSEIGRMSLDSTFEERERLNDLITESINDAATNWGLECLRYEIRDIVPNEAVKASLDLQSSAERRKRQKVLDAQGLASAITARATATAQSMTALANALESSAGTSAANLQLTQRYLQAYNNLGREETTMILPTDITDPKGMVGAPLEILDSVSARLRSAQADRQVERGSRSSKA